VKPKRIREQSGRVAKHRAGHSEKPKRYQVIDERIKDLYDGLNALAKRVAAFEQPAKKEPLSFLDGNMRANTRLILERCIEEGAAHGYRRAHKHVENPSDGAIADAISSAIWLEIDTYFDFCVLEQFDD